MNQFERAERLLGIGSIKLLSEKRVIIFGIGGVGSYTAEALIRTGLGKLTLVDFDTIELSNLNRQVHATHDTIGLNKVDVMKQRLHSINPCAKINAVKEFYSEESRDGFKLHEYDYVVDAIDSIRSKVDLLTTTAKLGIPVISSMGAGNKLDPTRFRVSDISNTSVCPLAKIVRRELRLRGVSGVKAVWSDENPIVLPDAGQNRVPGSVAFVPSVVGLIIAGEVIRTLIKEV